MTMHVIRLYTYWDADQAHTALELLEQIHDQIAQTYGDDIACMLKAGSTHPYVNEHQLVFDFYRDDPF